MNVLESFVYASVILHLTGMFFACFSLAFFAPCPETHCSPMSRNMNRCHVSQYDVGTTKVNDLFLVSLEKLLHSKQENPGGLSRNKLFSSSQHSKQQLSLLGQNLLV